MVWYLSRFFTLMSVKMCSGGRQACLFFDIHIRIMKEDYHLSLYDYQQFTNQTSGYKYTIFNSNWKKFLKHYMAVAVKVVCPIRNWTIVFLKTIRVNETSKSCVCLACRCNYCSRKSKKNLNILFKCTETFLFIILILWVLTWFTWEFEKFNSHAITMKDASRIVYQDWFSFFR